MSDPLSERLDLRRLREMVADDELRRAVAANADGHRVLLEDLLTADELRIRFPRPVCRRCGETAPASHPHRLGRQHWRLVEDAAWIWECGPCQAAAAPESPGPPAPPACPAEWVPRLSHQQIDAVQKELRTPRMREEPDPEADQRGGREFLLILASAALLIGGLIAVFWVQALDHIAWMRSRGGP